MCWWCRALVAGGVGSRWRWSNMVLRCRRTGVGGVGGKLVVLVVLAVLPCC